MARTRELPAGWFRADGALALVLAGAGVAAVFLLEQTGLDTFKLDPGWVALGAVALALPLAYRRRAPAVVAVVISALYIALGTWVGVELYASQVVLFLGVYSVGAWDPQRRRAFLTRLGIVVAMAAWLVVATIQGFWDPVTGERGVTAYLSFMLIQFGVNIAYFGAAWIFGDRAWQQALERAELERATAEIIAQQERLAENAVALDRVRIARELHDVVAHHVTSMGVQAAAARRLLDLTSTSTGTSEVDRTSEVTSTTARAIDSLRGVEGSARKAIGELHSLVHTLRDPGSGTDPLPGLQQLEDLVAHARSLGTPVELRRVTDVDSGDAPDSLDLSPGAHLTLYRVAQEALSNVRKHAGPAARTILTLRPADGGLELEISDSGRGRSAGAHGTGTGLQGMHERVEAVGGRLTVGPKSRGGWLVRAWVPAGGAR
ncbi:histidine kinase [Granulicoccus sp. GXG6511]|uniref:sensor histidine kinase n=1 Tax=Granulicoccus sp. GXG6511 TaxID=3381351 RepID=UPI003D7DD473